jgi:two-component system, chemotaxis family, sensor kinase CheA
LNQPDPIFVEEALGNLDAMGQALATVRMAEADAEQINAIFRHAHSIKGCASAFGLGQVAELMHHAESLLDPWRLGRRLPDADGVDLLLEAVDLARLALSGALRDASAIPLLVARLQAVAGEPAPTPWARRLHIHLIGKQGHLLEQAVRGLFRDIAGLGVVVSFAGDGHSSGMFEVQTSASNAELMDLLAMVADQAVIAIQDVAGSATGIAPLKHGIASVPALQTASPDGSEPACCAVPSSGLAQFEVSQAQTPGLRGSMRVAGDPVVQPDLPTLQTAQASASAQGTPVAELFALASAVLSSLAPALGKTFRLTVSGESVRLNRRLIQGLADPLIHLVRNACDHGIESAQDRRAAGKSAEGLITLSAALMRGELVLSVCDDGRGFSRSLLLRAAQARGIAVPADTPDHALWPLVFSPGFTTAAKLTEVSGRGIGMDVVGRKVSALGGSVEIESTAGLGACIRIHLPVS